MAQRNDSTSNVHGVASLSRLMDKSALAKYIYAILVVGIAGAVILSYNYNAKSAILVTSATLIGLAIILLFEKASRSSSHAVAVAGVILLFAASIFFVSFLAFTISVFAFSWPPAWGVFLGIQENNFKPQFTAISLSPDESNGQLQVKEWFCNNLNEDFEFSTMVANFPLESMPVTVQEQDEDWTHVFSEGEDYRIEWRYAVDPEDGKEYGFHMYLEENTGAYPSLFDTNEKKMAFLNLFGEPTGLSIMNGYQVGVREMDMFKGSYAFSFAFWDSADMVMVDWFSPRDIRLSAELCDPKAA